MAVKAFALIQDQELGTNDNTQVKLYVRVTVLGGDLGDLGGPSETISIDDIPTGLLGGTKTAIRDGVQTWLELHEVPFNPITDSVQLYE